MCNIQVSRKPINCLKLFISEHIISDRKSQKINEIFASDTMLYLMHLEFEFKEFKEFNIG